jgi:hypothetical protein
MLNSGPVYAFALLATGGAMATGCGGESKFENKPRPAAPVQLSGVINDKGVTVSPNKVGAGPVILLISNQTEEARTITLEGEDVKDTVGPVNPFDTAKLQQTLDTGNYEVRAGSAKAVVRELRPAKLRIGPPRKSSSNQVLLP